MLFQTSPWIGMSAQPARYSSPAAFDTVLHDLPPIRFDGQPIEIRLSLRRSDDGIWRGRVLFGAEGTEAERASAEIFCATSEQDLWQSVRDLRDHHLRDLYRSLL
jgi:hypothetical protein